MKTVLITGASSGIGLALAKEYVARGWLVIAGGRDEQRLAKLCEQSQVTPLIGDLSDEAQVIEMAKQLPNVDMIILNAGTCEYVDQPLEFDAALFKRVIDTNLIAVAYCLAHWLKKIKPQGQLAFTSSSASMLPLPRAQAYGASKAAVTYLAKTLNLDLAPYGIDVSVINPGFVQTPLTDKNDFSMPGMIDSQQAAARIANGLDKRTHQINFPKRLTWFLTLLGALPFSWWRAFAVRFLIRKDIA